MSKTKKPAKIAKQKPHTYKWTVLLSGYRAVQIEQIISLLEEKLDIPSHMTMSCDSLHSADEVDWQRAFDYNGWEEDTSLDGYTLFIRTKVGKYEIKAAKTIALSFIAGWEAAKNFL